MTTPAEVEAVLDEIEVVYGGESYTFPASLEDADGDVLDAIDDQKMSRAIRGLLGEKQWAKFKNSRPKVRDYAALFDAYAEAIGLSTGE